MTEQLCLFEPVSAPAAPIDIESIDPIGRYLPGEVRDGLTAFRWRYRTTQPADGGIFQHVFQTPQGERRLTTQAAILRWRALREVCRDCEADLLADPQFYAFGPGDMCVSCAERERQ